MAGTNTTEDQMPIRIANPNFCIPIKETSQKNASAGYAIQSSSLPSTTTQLCGLVAI
jgi:hypothetical protein